MEENSAVHMETDVSSTTDDVPETQEVTGSHGDMETVIVVEKVKDEDDTFIDEKVEQSQGGSKISSASTSFEKSSQKEAMKTIILKPPIIENNVAKKILLPHHPSPIQQESPTKILNKKIQLCVNMSPDTQQPESSGSSNVETTISPHTSIEKTTGTSPFKVSQYPVIHKSKFKDMSLVSKSPIKLKRMPPKVIKEDMVSCIQEKSPAKVIQEISNEEVVLQNNSNTELSLEMQDTSSNETLKFQESSTDTEVELQNTSSEESMLQNIPLPNEMIVEPTNNTELEKKSDKDTTLENSSSTETKSREYTSSTPSKAASTDSPINGMVPSFDTTMTNDKVLNTMDGDEKMDEAIVPTDMAKYININNELLNDSLSSSDFSEKENSKGISRELKSLIKSAKESKIINECTQLTSKTRKSRSQLDTSLNVSLEAEPVGTIRRGSTNSLISNSSEKSDRTVLKRSMRSHNPEFVNKCKQFLNSVTSKGIKGSDEHMSGDENNTNSKENAEPEQISLKKNKIVDRPIGKSDSDSYCWRCHWAVEDDQNDTGHPPMYCTVCPRSFHYKCLATNERKIPSEKNWVCGDCFQIIQAEGSDTRSPAMKKTSLGMLCELLKYALERMSDLNGVEPFMHPVDRAAFPDYDKYVVHPMNLSQMKQNIADGLYGSTEAFVADAQWILHNSIIFNTLQSKLTGGARALVRSCRAEMGEIEACPECYASAHARNPTWFTDVCSTPHVLLWAKLKGFPYWPAKGMAVNSSGLVDVRFFGAHDRAWVPSKDCYLFSEKEPNNFRTKRQDILDSMQEAEQYIRNISRKYGQFVYSTFKTPFEPARLNEQLKMMIPGYEGEIRALLKDHKLVPSPLTARVKKRSNSKCFKGHYNDGDGSDSEESSTSARTETIRHNRKSVDERGVKANSPATVRASRAPGLETMMTRKRRRSQMEEAVMTVIETSVSETKRKESSRQKKPEQKEANSSKEENSLLITKEAEVTPPKEESTFKKKTDNGKDKSKDEEPSSSTMEDKESLRVTPIKLVALPRANKQTPKMFTASKVVSKTGSPISENKFPQRRRSIRNENRIFIAEKAKEEKAKEDKAKEEKAKEEKAKEEKAKEEKAKEDKAKDDKAKSQKRRTPRANKSLNNTSTPKVAKTTVKKTESKNDSTDSSSKELKPKDNKKKEAKETDETKTAGNSLLRPLNTLKLANDTLKFDDDTILAVMSRETENNSGLPTISNVCSLSTTAQMTATTITPTTSYAKSIDVTVLASSNSSVFTPTSTDSVRNMKDAVTKLQKLRDNTEPPVVGRVGVRAFARMTSSERANEGVEVEIKAEPIDLEETDENRQNEKMDLMNACKLQRVNQVNQANQASGSQSLRDVRINRVVVTPAFTVRSGAAVEPRPRAKKSFPQPRREDGRSELNAKNNMVYIPIHPPVSQAPVRGCTVTPAIRPAAPLAAGNNTVNTVTTPLKPSTSALVSPSRILPAIASSPATGLATVGKMGVTTIGKLGVTTVKKVGVATVGQMGVTSISQVGVASVGQSGAPTVGQVGTTVHTVPLMTSVNGQWMFSLQPVMSVGGLDSSNTSPIVNGLPDRSHMSPAVVPVSSTGTLNAASCPSTPVQGNRAGSDTSTPVEMPRLQQRPSLQSATDSPSTSAVPSAAGPLTAKLNQSAGMLADMFRTLLEESIEKSDEPAAAVAALRLQMEQANWRHQQEIDELRHNYELTLTEMRLSFEKDKLRVMAEARRVAKAELEAAVKKAKSKQWCANCSQEAQFYCCWNTAYCDYPCQRTHWPHHFAHCAQRPKDGNEDETSPTESRLQPQQDNLPKSAPAQTPALTAGTKMTTTRVFAQDSPTVPKTSIIVSMIEDNSGNQTVKCVGTYKPHQAQGQIPPLLLNKQVMNEETGKKVVTTGGYLIVGAAGNSASVITPAPTRRPHIQYNFS